MSGLIHAIQFISGLCLIVLVLLQSQGSGLGRGWGGGGEFYRSRRGVEKVVYRGTIIAVIVFVSFSLFSAIQ